MSALLYAICFAVALYVERMSVRAAIAGMPHGPNLESLDVYARNTAATLPFAQSSRLSRREAARARLRRVK